MIKISRLTFMVITFLMIFVMIGCGDDDDDDSSSPADDDTVIDDDATDDDIVDDDVTDDDAVDDDVVDDDIVDDDAIDDDTVDDDSADDDTAAEIYVAPWPQNPVLPRDYDETGDPGLRRLKAQDYDTWHRTWHQPDHGSCAHCYFEDDTYTTITGYHGIGDSTIWTGTYLASQSMRYYVTDEAEAKQIAIEKVQTLSGHLHVTGRTGFIGRYWGSQDMLEFYGGPGWCEGYERCHQVDDGPFTGDFWIGETSRDQYTGWFYGMMMAYDLIDDEPTREIIRDDVAEVLDELISNFWWILDEQGLPTDAAPQVLPPMQLSWLTIGYHVTGEERFKTAIQDRLTDAFLLNIRINSIAFFNHYAQYFGNNLAHTNWFGLLRLARVYFSEEKYLALRKIFETQVHTFTRLSHNPWFTAIFMGEGDYTPAGKDDYQDQLEEDLLTFREPPLAEYHLEARDPGTYTLDPVSVFFHDMQELLPWLAELMGDINYQANEPFTVDLQCPGGFMFQWNPYKTDKCGSDTPTKVHSGHDYLAAYWTASYHKYITKEQ